MSFNSIFEEFQDNTSAISGVEYLKGGIKYCTNCNQPLQIKINTLGKEYLMPVKCSCQQEVDIKQQAKLIEIKRNANIEKLRNGITDAKYKAMTFEADLYKKIRFAHKYANSFKRYLKENIGLVIMGGTGSGKTFAAACIANAVVEQEYSVYMANMGYIIDRMTNLFSQDRLDYIAKLQRYSLLIIDDFGTSRDTDFANEQVYNLIDTRYRCGKPMIITTNLSPTDMKTEELKYKRTYERIKECCHPIILNGENLRTNIANERYKMIKSEFE